MSISSVCGMASTTSTETRGRRRLPIVLMGAAVIGLLAMPTIAKNQLGIGVTTVLTGSMRPAIDPGDLVVTSTSAASTIGVGDVVVVDSGGTAIAHRVVEARPINGVERLTTKGDANNAIDTDPVMVSPTAEVPRVIWRIPGIGSPLAYLGSPDAQRLAMTLLLGANLFALALFALRRRPVGAQDEPEGSPEETQHVQADIRSVDA